VDLSYSEDKLMRIIFILFLPLVYILQNMKYCVNLNNSTFTYFQPSFLYYVQPFYFQAFIRLVTLIFSCFLPSVILPSVILPSVIFYPQSLTHCTLVYFMFTYSTFGHSTLGDSTFDHGFGGLIFTFWKILMKVKWKSGISLVKVRKMTKQFFFHLVTSIA
jgi:hypothetical protein